MYLYDLPLSDIWKSRRRIVYSKRLDAVHVMHHLGLTCHWYLRNTHDLAPVSQPNILGITTLLQAVPDVSPDLSLSCHQTCHQTCHCHVIKRVTRCVTRCVTRRVTRRVTVMSSNVSPYVSLSCHQTCPLWCHLTRSQRQSVALSHAHMRMLPSRLRHVCLIADVHFGWDSTVDLQTAKPQNWLGPTVSAMNRRWHGWIYF